ncbi:MAG: hypothetical protein ABSF46_04100 [Terriglobia bacterium]|jgi:hypothetical protein
MKCFVIALFSVVMSATMLAGDNSYRVTSDGRPVLDTSPPRTVVYGGPFGFEKGMTRAQIVELVGKDAIHTDPSRDDVLWLNTAPKSHPAFASYILIISPENGLLKVVGVGKTIDVGDDGSDLREAFEETVTGVAQEYGMPKDSFDFCAGGTECDSARFWMTSLLNKNRTLSDVWDLASNPLNHVTGIEVEAKALKTNRGYVRYVCEFEGFSQYVEEKNTVSRR